MFYSEVAILSQMQHPNVLSLHGVAYIESEASNVASIVTPWMDEGDSLAYIIKQQPMHPLKFASFVRRKRTLSVRTVYVNFENEHLATPNCSRTTLFA